MTEQLDKQGLSGKYGFSSADWDEHAHYRPVYPPSLEKLIMDYHRTHSNSLRLAHNIGSGTGVFVPTLANYFSHVHVSDPDDSYVELARSRLSAYHENNWARAKFTFSQCPPEKSHLCVAKGSVDFASIMEAVPWYEAEDLMKSVAESLAPNGTLALFYYKPAPSVLDSDNVHAAVQGLFEAWQQIVLKKPTDSTPLTSKLPQINSGLDFVPLPETFFIQDVTKRIYINACGKKGAAFRLPGKDVPVAASKISSEHRIYEFEDSDEEGSGWRQNVDASWFRGLLSSMGMEGKEDFLEEHFSDIARQVNETMSDGKVTIEWTAAVLLATRK